jgi:proline dehydrogenase
LISPVARAPAWEAKADTDAAYDACSGLLLDAIAADLKKSGARRPQGVALLCWTHNWASCKGITKGERGLAAPTGMAS